MVCPCLSRVIRSCTGTACDGSAMLYDSQTITLQTSPIVLLTPTVDFSITQSFVPPPQLWHFGLHGTNIFPGIFLPIHPFSANHIRLVPILFLRFCSTSSLGKYFSLHGTKMKFDKNGSKKDPRTVLKSAYIRIWYPLPLLHAVLTKTTCS